ESGRAVVHRGDQEEGHAEAGRVREQEGGALDGRVAGRGEGQDPAEDDPDAWRPADRKDRPEPEGGRPAAAGADEPSAEAVGEAAARRITALEREGPGRI